MNNKVLTKSGYSSLCELIRFTILLILTKENRRYVRMNTTPFLSAFIQLFKLSKLLLEILNSFSNVCDSH